MEEKKNISSGRLFVSLRQVFGILLLFISCFQAMPVMAQTKTVEGTVKDEKGIGLNAITVSIKGGTGGTSTNANGMFKIMVPGPNAVLVFSSVGFATKEITVGSQTEISVVLTAANNSMDEVVVVGYGTQRKKDVTGAISSVSAKQIEERQAIDVLDAMQGQAPGLQIAQESGRPGAGNSVRIRGIGTLQGGADPLYIVDGAQGVNIDGINPNDIESIEILKDAASAAIYGSRSANGVVIITTKKGKEGKPTLDVRYLTSLSKLSHKIPQSNAELRRLLEYKRNPANGGFNTDSLNPSFNADNDYQDMLTRTANRQQVDVSLGGASRNLNYYGSLGYLKDEGIIINSWAKIMRGRFNIDYKATDKLTYGNRIQFSYQTENRINDGNTLNQAIQRPPNFRVYFADGTLAGQIGGRRNPVAEALLRKNEYQIMDGNFYNYVSYQFLPELKLTVDANVKAKYTHHLTFAPRLLSSSNDNDGSDENDLNTYWMTQAYLNYNKTFAGSHSLTAVFGVSADRNFSRGSEISGTNYVSEEVTTLNSPQVYNIPNTREERFTSVSAFGRLGYSYKGKYLFNSNFRADASSKFGKQNRWGYFPSASVGWRFSEEPFMRWAYDYLGEGKIRASYGVTGNDRIGEYDAIRTYSFGASDGNDNGNWYNGVSGVAPSATFGNPALSWEETRQTNIGLDLTFLKGRITFTADYYNKITDKLLYQAPLPYESGFNEVNVNIGSIQNKGFEFVINSYPVRNKDFSWNLIYNMSFNNASIKSLYGGIPITSTNWITQEGQRLGNFYGWQALGVYQYDESNAYTDNWEQLTPVFVAGTFTGYTLDGKAYNGTVNRLKTAGNILKGGDMIWLNNSKDSVIDDADRIPLGNAQPKWIAGLSNQFSYKNFSLSFNVYVSWGGLLYDRGRQQLNQNTISNVTPDPEYIRDSWSQPGDITKWPTPKNNGMGNGRELSSLYLEDASFIRLRNVRLTYSLNKSIANKMKLKGATVYLYGNNLLTWTNYFWYDPEIAFNNALEMGQDSGRYPRKREFGAGVNLNF
jgi:TonB-linked SusC/RagA family outer membrane protein